MIDTKKLRRAGDAVFITTEETVAQDLSDMLIGAANEIDELRDLVDWMLGCDYDFCQHKYFCDKRNKLLKGDNSE